MQDSTPSTPETFPSEDPKPSRFPRWLKRLLWVTLWLFTLAALLIAFENWRGRRAWRAFAAEMEAKGERLDFEAVVPPEAAEAENFAAAPIFRPLFDFVPGQGADGSPRIEWRDPQAKEALEKINPSPAEKSPGKVTWRQGAFLDLAAWQKYYREQTDFPKAPQPRSAGADVLLALSRFDRELNTLRAVSSRPRSRFPLRYRDHVAMHLPHASVLRSLGAICQLRAVAALAENQMDAAFQDTLLAIRIGDAFAEEPIAISLLVRVAIWDIAMQPLWEGLNRHQWTEEQLAEFERRIAAVNLAEHYQRCIRGERNLMGFAVTELFNKHPDALLSVFNDGKAAPGASAGTRLAPTGFLDQNKVAMGRAYQGMLECVDPQARRFDPECSRAMAAKIDRELGSGASPYTILAHLVMPAFAKIQERCASGQGTLHLARIAIALERHRLRHGSLPEALDQIDPAALPSGGLPLDPATGSPARYARVGQEQFTLYFQGWNGTDDGGKVVWKEGEHPQQDFTKGDWVWPQPAS